MGRLDDQLEAMEAVEAEASFGRLRALTGVWQALFLALTFGALWLFEVLADADFSAATPAPPSDCPKRRKGENPFTTS